MQNIFREYDIRGIFPDELNAPAVQAIGYLLGARIPQTTTRCVAIGYDARTHSRTLFEWLASGFAKADCEVLDLGLIPTPVAYFAMFEESAKPQLSVMITGAHN
ncbi:MAG: phosphomannomutase/phosphoglucomutase, partial [Helicobacter sp.]|nr:phosphomannomutase/phosphoglucomutase [Helicobacter sp.]